MNDPDDDLKELYARERAVDHARAPHFGAMRARTLSTAAIPRSIALGRWVLTAAAASVLLIVSVLLPRPAPRTTPTSYDTLARELDRAQASLQDRLAAQRQLTAWQSPTDYLLNPPPRNHP